jgi:phosphoribosylaminoimidazole carboxylase PurE protein
MKKPLVSIIMGSKSDLAVMEKAAEVFESFNISYEIDVISAHRTPKKMYEYASAAERRGIKVIIAGAGGAAHLPGMTAALTKLPVIGVPIETKTMKGLDSLLSIAQMPFGVPVATVAINAAGNGALLTIKILALQDSKLSQKLDKFYREQEEKVARDSQEVIERF